MAQSMTTATLRRRLSSGLAALGLGALALTVLPGCGPSFNFVYMAKDSGGNQKTTKFASIGDEIHCVMEVKGGGQGTVVSFELDGPSGLSLSDNDLYPHPQGNQGPVTLDMQLLIIDAEGNEADQGPWPIGDYLLDVFLDDGLEESLDFEVVP